jgi:hypothetical protein
MTEVDTTEIDLAHAAMVADDADDLARLRFYERLAESELFMLLEAEVEGDQISPAMFEAEDQQFVLIFDREARMSEFYGKAIAPYAALSGRGMAQMLEGQRIGMALNMGVAPSAMLVSTCSSPRPKHWSGTPPVVTWCASTHERADCTRARCASGIPCIRVFGGRDAEPSSCKRCSS